MKSILIIAGLDPSGGAGIHADILTVRSLGFHPSTVITTITYQNTCRIYDLHELDSDVVANQLKSVLEDLNIAGIKIGLICSYKNAEEISGFIKDLSVPKVLDPILKSSSGFDFLNTEVYEVLAEVCDVMTPNVYEAEKLSNLRIKSVEDAKICAKKLAEMFNCSVVITGGSLNGIDVIYDGQTLYELKSELLDIDVHGTGCVYSSALTCFLAMGFSLFDSCKMARDFVLKAVGNSKRIGRCLRIVWI